MAKITVTITEARQKVLAHPVHIANELAIELRKKNVCFIPAVGPLCPIHPGSVFTSTLTKVGDLVVTYDGPLGTLLEDDDEL